jgi:lactoylglutathione lyase
MSEASTANGEALNSFGVGINVVDLDRSAWFYKLLGLEEITRFSPVEGMVEAIFRSPGADGPNLILVAVDEPRDPPTIGTGLSRLVAFVPDLAAVSQRLTAAGFEVGTPASLDSGVRIAFATDPDGYPVELIETA